MNRKEILKDSFSKAKLNFWVYLAAVAICFIITGLSDGVFKSSAHLTECCLLCEAEAFLIMRSLIIIPNFGML